MTAMLLAAIGLTGCANAAPGSTHTQAPESPLPSETSSPVPSAAPEKPAAGCDFTGTRELFNPEHPEETGLFYIKLTNTGSTGCQLSGFPDAALVSSTGQIVGGPASQLTDIPEQSVSVEPGGSAYVLIGFRGRAHFASCNLVGADGIRVRLHKSGQDVQVDVKDLAICDQDTAGWLIFNFAPTRDNVIS